MKILHYTGSDDDRGGIVSVVRALATAEIFDCVLGVNAGCRQYRSPPLPTLDLPRISGESIDLRTMLRSRLVAQSVRSWLNRESASVFHGHSRAGMLTALWLHYAGERRVVVSVHCYGRHRWFYRWAARRLGPELHWLSPAMKRHYGIDAGADPWAQCIPGCVPARTSPLPREKPHHPDTLRLGGIGSIVRWKRWDLILAALSLLPAELRSRTRFAHIGTAPDIRDAQRYAAELRDRSAASSLAGMVEWSGEKPSADELLRRIDCLVVASRNEPFSIAMLEALQVGVPVLAADSGGPPDAIVPGRNGWLFRSGDAADLAQRITMLLEKPRLGEDALEFSQIQRFEAPAVAKQWLHVYRRVTRTEPV